MDFLHRLKKNEMTDKTKFLISAESHKALLPFRSMTRERWSGSIVPTNRTLTLNTEPAIKSFCSLPFSQDPCFRKASLPAPAFNLLQPQLKIKAMTPQRIEKSFPDRLILDSIHWVILLKSFMKTANQNLHYSLNLVNQKKNLPLQLPLKHLTKAIRLQELWDSKNSDFNSRLNLSLPEKPQFFVQAQLQFTDACLSFPELHTVHKPQRETHIIRQVALSDLLNFSESKLTSISQLLYKEADLQIATHKNKAMAFASLEFAPQKKSQTEKLKTTLKHKKLRPMKSGFHFSYIPEWLDIEFRQRNADTKTGQLNFFAGSVKNASNVDLNLQRN